MAFEGLTAKLNAAFKKLRGKGRLSESDIKEAMREIRLALLEADVSYKVVKDFVKSVSERCSGQDVMESLTPAQTIVKIVNEELIRLMGSENQRISISPKPPTVVMLVGLQGAGKTTNGAKLAGLFKKQGKRPLLVACDIYRPAAIKQLEVVGGQLGIPVFQMGQENPVKIAKAAVRHAQHRAHVAGDLDAVQNEYDRVFRGREVGKFETGQPAKRHQSVGLAAFGNFFIRLFRNGVQSARARGEPFYEFGGLRGADMRGAEHQRFDGRGEFFAHLQDPDALRHKQFLRVGFGIG